MLNDSFTFSPVLLATTTAACLLGMSFYLGFTKKQKNRRKLDLLGENSRSSSFDDKISDINPIEWKQSEAGLGKLKDRLGKAGFFNTRSRRVATISGISVIGSSVLFGAIILLSITGKGPLALVGAFIGFYFGLLSWLYYLRSRANNLQRELLFRLPLCLEAILLLVQSGLGILPAIQTVVDNEKKKRGANPVVFLFSLVYELAASGLPLSSALEIVANSIDNRVIAHVFLHLDISANEGGELGTSLRSLSDYAHSEWKLSVETRVRRLENLVVFPVFCALFGLVFITVAVPIVPIADFMKKMSNEQQNRSEAPLVIQNQSITSRGNQR